MRRKDEQIHKFSDFLETLLECEDKAEIRAKIIEEGENLGLSYTQAEAKIMSLN